MSNLKERLDLLREEIQKDDFLDGKGLSNEVNIRIFCYDPAEEMTVTHFLDQIKIDQSLNCRLIECNLYKTFFSICDDLDITDAIPEMEEADGGIFLLEQLHSAIGEGEFIDKIQYEPHKRGDVLISITSGDAKSRIDQALEYLVAHVYSELGLIEKNAETDADIIEILTGNFIAGAEPNRDAAAKVEEYLIVQDRTKLPTSMFDVQSRYQGIPYGWREIDIAAVVALLINQQKVTIKYGGATIQPNDPKLPDMLRKKSEIGKTSISKRQVVTAVKMKAVKDLLREYFDVMDVPDDEDGLVAFIVKKFEDQKAHYEALEQRYVPNRRYPDKGKVQAAIQLATEVLSQKKDNIALIDRVLKLEDKLFDSKEDLQEVESFFKTQVQVFDAAAQMEEDLRNELDYLPHEPEANDALNKIRLIVVVQGGFSYKKIPELNSLMTNAWIEEKESG